MRLQARKGDGGREGLVLLVWPFSFNSTFIPAKRVGFGAASG